MTVQGPRLLGFVLHNHEKSWQDFEQYITQKERSGVVYNNKWKDNNNNNNK